MDENYAYMSTEMEGYVGNILVVYDHSDPTAPKENLHPYRRNRQEGPSAIVGMRSFGASAPYKDLYRNFAITPEAVVEAVRAGL